MKVWLLRTFHFSYYRLSLAFPLQSLAIPPLSHEPRGRQFSIALWNALQEIPLPAPPYPLPQRTQEPLLPCKTITLTTKVLKPLSRSFATHGRALFS
jgi:hypothetical protein